MGGQLSLLPESAPQNNLVVIRWSPATTAPLEGESVSPERSMGSAAQHGVLPHVRPFEVLNADVALSPSA